MFEFRLYLCVFFLQFSDLVVFYFDFLNGLVVLCMCLRSLDSVFFLFALELCNHFPELFVFSLVANDLIVDFLAFVEQANDFLIDFLVDVFLFLEVLVVLGPFLEFLIDILLEFIPLPLDNVEFLPLMLLLDRDFILPPSCHVPFGNHVIFEFPHGFLFFGEFDNQFFDLLDVLHLFGGFLGLNLDILLDDLDGFSLGLLFLFEGKLVLLSDPDELMEVLLVLDFDRNGLHEVTRICFIFCNFLDFLLLGLLRLVDFLFGAVHQSIHLILPPFLLLTIGLDCDDLLFQTLDLLVVLHILGLQLLQIVGHVLILRPQVTQPRIDCMQTC